MQIRTNYTYSQQSYLRIRWAGCVHFVNSDDKRFDAHGVSDVQIFPELPSLCDGQLELLLWRWHNQNYSIGLLKEKASVSHHWVIGFPSFTCILSTCPIDLNFKHLKQNRNMRALFLIWFHGHKLRELVQFYLFQKLNF